MKLPTHLPPGLRIPFGSRSSPSSFFAPAQAQSIATLQGRVVDPADAIVPGARIVVRSRETCTKHVTQTDNEGNDWVGALPVGTYGVVPSAPGFQTQLMEDLNIEAARITRAGFSAPGRRYLTGTDCDLPC